MNDMTPYKPPSRASTYLGHAVNVGKFAWKNREWLQDQYKKYAPKRARGAPRNPDTPGARGRVSARTGPGGTSKFKRAWNKLDIFRSVPSINHTHLDLHSSLQFTLRSQLDANGASTATSAHIFSTPLEISDLEPFDHYQFPVVNALSKASLAKVADASARGYPCNQLLSYYNNYAVKSVEMKVDCRLVDRNPGGTVSGEDVRSDQAGQVTVPVNIALLRVTKSELDYILNELPALLKDGDTTNKEFDSAQLSRYDRVLREQFGVCPLNMGAHRREGTVSTKWKASVADSCKESDIIEGISDSYKMRMPENGHIGVTDGTRITQHPPDTHYLVILGWISPRCLSELLDGRPNTREVQVIMDCHVRQYIALGDVLETKAGISSGSDIVTRTAPVQEPVLKRARI